MSETREIHDPFDGKTVHINNDLVRRLRGQYAVGPTLPSGEPEFGWREYQTVPIQVEAAGVIERQRAALLDLRRFFEEDMDGGEDGNGNVIVPEDFIAKINAALGAN